MLGATSAAKDEYVVVLAGNPNAGKTTLFNALTHSRRRTGNYHGVTTSAAKKTIGGITYCDVPGSYSFNAYTMEERDSVAAIEGANAVVCVIDATVLPSALNLVRRIISANPFSAVYLTKLRLLKKRHGNVDCDGLSSLLGVPVFTAVNALRSAVSAGFVRAEKPVQMPLDRVYYGGNAQISFAERLFYNKYFACVFYVFALVATFYMAFSPDMIGAAAKAWLEDLLCVKLSSVIVGGISNPVLASFISDGVVGGVGGVLSFVPQLAVLYASLILLEESGISSAISFVTDGLFQKAGLSGRATFSLVSGFGCTAAAISTTRGFSEESSRRRTIAALPFIPCGAKMPVFLTFLSPLFKNPFVAICAFYFGGLVLAVCVSALLRGEKEGLISEVAPIGFPSVLLVFKRLYFQLKSFIIKVTTFVFAFCVVSWLLSHLSFAHGFCSAEESIVGTLSKGVCVLFYPMGITDWRIAYAAITGFAAKENVAATIALLFPQGLSLPLAPTLALCTFFLCCPACVSAFAASVREIGLKRTLAYNAAQLAFAFCASYLICFISVLV